MTQQETSEFVTDLRRAFRTLEVSAARQAGAMQSMPDLANVPFIDCCRLISSQ